MTKYTLRFINNSSATRSFLCYQQDPNIGVPDVVSLAWFAKQARPGTVVDFAWTIDYSFVWSQTGVLTPGVTFIASQSVPADPAGVNKIQFDYVDGAYGFEQPATGGSAGSLTINTSAGFPANQAAIGIGMSGSGTFAVQAYPNDNAIFTPHPQYWVAFGNFLPGQVLDITNISNPANVAFPANVYAMVATLNSDFTWTIQPLGQANAELVRRPQRMAEYAYLAAD
ncbi:MAG: protein rhiA [Pseudomonadota bacterium]